jgi:hypothetical protein
LKPRIDKDTIYWADETLKNDPTYMMAAMQIEPSFGDQFCGSDLFRNEAFLREAERLDPVLRIMATSRNKR